MAVALSQARRASAGALLRWRVEDATRAARRTEDLPVWRLHGPLGRTAILKAAVLRDEDWPPRPSQSDRQHAFLNEVSSLEFLTRRNCRVTPRFLGADPRLGLVVMEDLGDGRDVASVLIGGDAGAALAALSAWAEAVADLHAASHGHTREYEALRARGGAPGPKFDVSNAADRIQSAMRLSFDPAYTNPPALADLVKTLARELASPQWQVVSPHDICPDNNVVLGDGTVRLFDFGWGGVRHALVDVAYLHTVMPTCWCAGRLPPGVVRLATQRYRERAGRSIVRARDGAAFEHALTAARAGLALASLVSRLNQAADVAGGERKAIGGYDYVGYSARQKVVLRLEDLAQLATERPLFEPLGALAHAIRARLVGRFGEVERVPMYPAFQSFEGPSGPLGSKQGAAQ